MVYDYDKLCIGKKFLCILHDKKQFHTVSAQFSELKTNLERVNFMYALLRKHKLLPKYEHSSKSNAVSTAIRLRGNIYYDLGNNLVAMKLYTKSIQSAERNSDELSKSLANRSAVLLRLKLFRESLVDIERALALNPLPSVVQKLTTRKQKALRSLSKQSTEPYYGYGEAPTIPDSKRNTAIECTSSSVQIATNRCHGRQVVATKPIKIGELIAVEESFMKLVPFHVFTYCDHCCTLCYTLMPCYGCLTALYCSEECRQRAFDEYHKYECKIITRSIAEMLERKDLFPLRTVLKAFQEGYGEDKEPLNEDCYKSNRFHELRKLQTNLEKQSTAKLMEYATKAALYYYLLNSFSTFFQAFNDRRDLFKEAVLEMFLVYSCNAIDIFECVEGDLKTTSQGLYSFASLFNHSCIANTFFCFHGTKVAVYASQTIQKGEECLINYSFLSFAMNSSIERQYLLLERYYFDCDCKACIYDWELDFNEWSHRFIMEAFIVLDRLFKARNRDAIRVILNEMAEKLRRHEFELKFDLLATFSLLFSHCFHFVGNSRKQLK